MVGGGLKPIGCTLMFGLGVYGGVLLTHKPDKAYRTHPTEQERKAVFDKLAKRYDQLVRVDEMLLGIKRKRKQLIGDAEGDILEVAVGTGRNFSYYDQGKAKSLTATDFSRPMLRSAVAKKAELRGIPVRFCLLNSLSMEFQDNSFDTTVETFGICSYEKPVETLKEMQRVTKPDGRILLLEHGAPETAGFARRWLNRSHCAHAHKCGCYYDRDILAIVAEAGLDVDRVETANWGTTYVIRAQPSEQQDKKLVT